MSDIFKVILKFQRETWLMPLGNLLDQWEVNRQFNWMAKAKRNITSINHAKRLKIMICAVK